MPPRKTPLRAKTPLASGSTPLRRAALLRQSARTREAAEKPRKPLVSKPAPVTPEERRARRLVRARSNGVCEGCDRARAAHWAHRVRRDVGPWCPSNGLDLCAACHTGWAHANPTAPVRLALHGWVLLDPDGGFTSCDPPADYPNPDRSAA